MEMWRKVWRDGVAPQFSVEQLEVLQKALLEDDPRLIQGATTQPPPLVCVQDWAVEGGCLMSYPFAFDAEHDEKYVQPSCYHPNKADLPHGLCKVSTRTVGEVEEHFARVCFDVDQVLGEPAACQYLLKWFDETPREQMRRELEVEVNNELLKRRAAVEVA